MSAKILVVGQIYPPLEAELAARYEVHHLAHPSDIGSLTDEARQATIVVSGGSSGASSALMSAVPGLRLIAVFGVGIDKVDLAAARSRNIVVSNTPDVLTDDVADLAVGLVFAVIRRIAANDRFVRSGQWGMSSPPPLASRITGQRIGIFGLGRIGLAIGKRLEPVAGELWYHNRRPRADAPYGYVPSLLELAAKVDILVAAVSGGPESAGAIDTAVLNALGPRGTLINIARGSVVDQPALVDALREGRLGGAGLDVFTDEPRVPDALWAMDTVVLQPHQASATVETRRAMADLVLANVEAHLTGRALPSAVS